MNDAYESIFLRRGHCKADYLGEAWGKKPEEYDEKPSNKTYFEKQNGQITPLDVCLSHK